MSMDFETTDSNQTGLLGGLRESILRLLSQVELLGSDHPSLEGTQGTSLSEEVRRFEIKLITNALLQTQGHQLRAARLLGVKLTTLNSKIKRYDLTRKLRDGLFDSTVGTERNQLGEGRSDLEIS
jgi:DNA-binding NtrC family response regulator